MSVAGVAVSIDDRRTRVAAVRAKRGSAATAATTELMGLSVATNFLRRHLPFYGEAEIRGPGQPDE
jgi:hypothetical protein